MKWRMYFVTHDQGHYYHEYEDLDEAMTAKRWGEARNEIYVVGIRDCFTEAIWFRHPYRGGVEAWKKGNMKEFKMTYPHEDFDDYKWRPYSGSCL